MHHLLHTHAGLREARGIAVAPIRLLHIFAQGKFDVAGSFFEFELLGICYAPAQLDELRLTANAVGRAMQQIAGGYATGELAVDVYVVGVKGIADAHLRGDAAGAFVYAAGNGYVTVLVD